ncbi:unnamed protein product [Bemisia tabaci]|uniref:Inositol-tetrakisphosphate 1-kinase n=1 Tax=Bemisia tabaci TaxID=7038 RepID=A0A9P0AA24_BEMTA|nr:unnamed protein product [Bemisia tabaci]
MSATEEVAKKPQRIIGYWLSDKKSKKKNWLDFGQICRNHGFHLVKLDLNKPLEEQGPFSVILHKMTDILVGTDEKSISMVERVETYVQDHPKVIVIDPLDNVRKVLNRFHCYSAISIEELEKHDVFIPSFVELTSTDPVENLKKLKAAKVTFPFVCKPSPSHTHAGSVDSHKMAVIFNERNLSDCEPPCVAQSFINHNALLFKIFVVGDVYQIVERPSLKNFQPSESEQSIFFHSHDVSKPGSTSCLNVLDAGDASSSPPVIDKNKTDALVSIIRQELGLSLFGIDFIVTNDTGKYAIIDVNVFPGYEGFPDFFEMLVKYISKIVTEEEAREKVSESVGWSSPLRRYSYKSSENSDHSETVSPMETDVRFIHPSLGSGLTRDQDDSGFDTSDSSDERKSKYRPSHCINLQSSVSKSVLPLSKTSSRDLLPDKKS